MHFQWTKTCFSTRQVCSQSPRTSVCRHEESWGGCWGFCIFRGWNPSKREVRTGFDGSDPLESQGGEHSYSLAGWTGTQGWTGWDDGWAGQQPRLNKHDYTSAIEPGIDVVVVPRGIYELIFAEFVDWQFELTLPELDLFLRSEGLGVGVHAEQTWDHGGAEQHLSSDSGSSGWTHIAGHQIKVG